MQAVTDDRIPVRVTTANHCIQATPDFALLFIVAQVSGASDAGRSAQEMIHLQDRRSGEDHTE
jgi:hypothetical protein